MALLYVTRVLNGISSFLGEYANMILMRCGALHLTLIGIFFAGARVPEASDSGRVYHSLVAATPLLQAIYNRE